MNSLGDELMDIFTFIKGYNLTFGITSKWFQDLWYPLSKSHLWAKRRDSSPFQGHHNTKGTNGVKQRGGEKG
jgi:hypothetical protein